MATAAADAAQACRSGQGGAGQGRAGQGSAGLDIPEKSYRISSSL